MLSQLYDHLHSFGTPHPYGEAFLMTGKTKLAKELRKPDQFQVQVMSGMDWLQANIKPIMAGVVTLVVIAVSFFGWRFWQDSQTNSQQTELALVELEFLKESEAADKQRELLQKQIEALEAKAGTPADPAAASDTPALVALSAEDQLAKTVAEAQLTAIKADHTASAAAYRSFHQKYPDSPEGWMAGLRAVSVMLEKREFPAARDLLAAIVAQSKNDEFYQIQGRLAYVGVLEELGEFDQALAETERLLELANEDLKPQMLLVKGRIQYLKNTKPEAIATLDTIIEQHATSPEAQKARAMRALLN